jgi:oligoribonuclease NrnB/cAMP/cGMP phosphodiesterase (DHH superfamily)
MKKILVLYHKNCPDGFGAAWVAWKKFGAKAEYCAVDPETLPETFPIGREIYALDVSYPLAVQKELRAKNYSLIILDHHVSNEKDTRYFKENVFDNNHSGAVLAWKYFYPTQPLPRLLRYIEDVDLWRRSLPQVDVVMPYIYMQERNFTVWNKLVRDFAAPKGFRNFVSRGSLLYVYEQSAIADILSRAMLVKFEGKKVYAINNSLKRYTSELGGILVKKKAPMALIWYEDEEGLKVSLRSDGTVDVSKIAGKYGGGGHRSASSFIVKNRIKPWKKI